MPKLTPKQEEFLALPIVATVTTLRRDGSPHNTVVWVDTEDGVLRFNTADGRAKPKHLRRDDRVAVTVIDPENSHRWISVGGRARLTHEGAAEHIDSLAKKYTGKEVFSSHDPASPRITVVVEADRIDATGLDD